MLRRSPSNNQYGISRHQQGLSLIELLIAMTIGIFAVGAAMSVLSVSEGRKRSLSSVNDVNQAGAYAVYQLDQAIRSAGTGLGHESATGLGLPSAYGCILNIAKNGSLVAPAGKLKSPFNKISGKIRLAPVLIRNGPNNTSGDVILTMSGTSGRAETPTKFANSGSSTAALNLENNVNFLANDKVLLVGSAQSNCFVSQVSNTFTASESNFSMDLSGEYYAAKIKNNDITDANAYVINLGQSVAFRAFAADGKGTLYSYDLLTPYQPLTAKKPNPSTFINSVEQIQAIYGIEKNGVFQWTHPTKQYAYAAIQTDLSKIMSIKAIKIAVVMKTALDEKEKVTNPKITLFSDTNVSMSLKIKKKDRYYRYQVFEITVPVRNNLLQP